MTPFNIYLCGVGGQGIGLLAEVLGEACRAAGHTLHGCDTHGVAQRHGVVASHLRLGEQAYTPRIAPAGAQLVVALERLEALRGASRMLARGGMLVYYDVVYQPVPVRLRSAAYPSSDDVARLVAARGGRLERVLIADLPDPRMQNAALLGRLGALEIVPGVGCDRLRAALEASLPEPLQRGNLEAFAAGSSLRRPV